LKSRLRFAGLGLGLLLLLAGCVPLEVVDAERTASFVVTADPVELQVESSNGDVEIIGFPGATTVHVTARTWSRGTTTAEAMARLARVSVDMIQEGNRITLRYDAASHDLDVRRYSGVDFRVEVPEETHADVDTTNGWIQVEQISGVLDLETSNGRIDVEESLTEATARSSNGRIRFEDVEGILDLRTSNGRIELENVDGVVHGETSNGSITYSGYLYPDVDHSLTTTNGAINLALRSDASLTIDAQVTNGQIVSTLPLVGDTEGNAWLAVLNAPAAGRLTLRTSNGQITMHGIF